MDPERWRALRLMAGIVGAVALCFAALAVVLPP